MSKIKDPIVYLDKVAREKNVDLKERGVNKRSFAYDSFLFEYSPSGSMVKLKIYDDFELQETHTVDTEMIVSIWENLKARGESGYEEFRKQMRGIDSGLFGP